MKKNVMITAGIVLIAVVLFSAFYFLNRNSQIDDSIEDEISEDEQIGEGIIDGENEEETQEAWIDKGLVIPGTYADSDIVDIGDGKYRIYYSLEPEVAGFNGQVYSAISSDGVNWETETGTRKEQATFPSVIKLSDGKYRMYFQNSDVIKSAISSDGLTWTDESGTRMNTENNLGLTFRNVLAPTVMKIGSEYVMVYAGAIEEKYSGPEDSPSW